MADAQCSAGVSARACSVCCRALPVSAIKFRHYKCSACRGHHKAYVARRRAAGLSAHPASKAWKKRNPQKVNSYKRKKRAEKAALGLNDKGEIRKNAFNPRYGVIRKDFYESAVSLLCAQNARQAWRYWLNVKSPNWWMIAYYEVSGKPWNNPRLSSGESWKLRYKLDRVFHAKELLKLQRLKFRRREYIDKNSDGTLTALVLATLIEDTEVCTYCRVMLDERDKTLDHVIPITRGGQHSITNVCICCKTCNTSKGNRLIDEWIASMLSKRIMNEEKNFWVLALKAA